MESDVGFRVLVSELMDELDGSYGHTASMLMEAIKERLASGGDLRWAVERWTEEVKNRPLENIHRRTLDETWRQVIRRLGGNDAELCR